MPPRHQVINRIADSYKAGRWLTGYIRGKLGADPVFDTALAELTGRSGCIVDLGCGLGLMGLWLRAHAHNAAYTGCDLGGWKVRAGTAAASRLGHQEITLTEADMTSFPLEGAHAVLAFDVLHYLPLSSQQRLIQRLAAAARSGSLILVRTGVRDCGWRSTATLLEEWWTRATGWIRGGEVNFPSLETLVSEFQSMGCNVEARPLWGRTPFSSHWLRISARD